MKSTGWRFSSVFSVALAVGLFAACDKDAESKPLNTDRVTKPAPAATRVVPEPGVKASAVELKAPDTLKGAVAVRGTLAAPGKGVAPETVVARKAAPRGKGAKIKTDFYILEVVVPPSVANGAAGQVKVNIKPKPGWHLNMEFPTKLTVIPPAGATVAKKTQKRGDAAEFSENKATFNVDFKANKSGNLDFKGKFRFAVCSESTCDPKSEKLAWAVSVK